MVSCEGLRNHAPLVLLLSLAPVTSAYSFVISGANRTSITVAIVLSLCNPATIYASGGQLQVLAGSFVAVLLYLTLSLVLWSTALMLLASFCFRHWIPICKIVNCFTNRRQANRLWQEASCLLDVLKYACVIHGCLCMALRKPCPK